MKKSDKIFMVICGIIMVVSMCLITFDNTAVDYATKAGREYLCEQNGKAHEDVNYVDEYNIDEVDYCDRLSHNE